MEKPTNAIKNVYSMAKYLCRKKQISMHELEKEIGVSQGYLSRVGSGKKVASLEIAIKIANYFEISVDDLLNGPPKLTNADVAMEIFKLSPKEILLMDHKWWDQEYSGIFTI